MWQDIVRTVAPAIASVFGTPLAGVAVGFLTEAILGPGVQPSETTRENLEAAILGATPETLARIKEAEQKFKVEMKKLDIDLERIHGADRASARAMAITTSLRPQMVLGTVVIGGFCGVVWVVFSGSVPIAPEVQPLMNILLGILAAAVTQVLNFFFGSSSGSKEKTAALAGGK